VRKLIVHHLWGTPRKSFGLVFAFVEEAAKVIIAAFRTGGST
jgi:hypothetical protein